MRATRNNPKYSVMFVDDIGIELAKREGLIEHLPREQIPNMERVLKRFHLLRRLRRRLRHVHRRPVLQHRRPASRSTAMPICGSRGSASRFLMETPKSTQSLYLLIAAVSVETGKPYAETQYMIEQAWPKMEALKPNVLSIFENQTTVMQVAQGQADIAGMFYSKSVYPYTVKGAPVDMCYPREGTFAGINCLTLVKNAPDRELAIAFINRMLDPGSAAGAGGGDA